MAYKDKGDAIRYNNEFNKGAYDRINLTVPKGKKAEIQAAAQAAGESVNAYIFNAIAQRMASEQGGAGGYGFFSGKQDISLCSGLTSPTGQDSTTEPKE